MPVIKNAEEKNFLGIARTMNDLAERARAKKLKPEEVQESTFCITNPGTFGGLFGLPIISQPNVAILGLGAIEKRPVVIDDAIAIRSMVYLTLSYAVSYTHLWKRSARRSSRRWSAIPLSSPWARTSACMAGRSKSPKGCWRSSARTG